MYTYVCMYMYVMYIYSQGGGATITSRHRGEGFDHSNFGRPKLEQGLRSVPPIHRAALRPVHPRRLPGDRERGHPRPGPLPYNRHPPGMRHLRDDAPEQGAEGKVVQYNLVTHCVWNVYMLDLHAGG